MGRGQMLGGTVPQNRPTAPLDLWRVSGSGRWGDAPLSAWLLVQEAASFSTAPLPEPRHAFRTPSGAPAILGAPQAGGWWQPGAPNLLSHSLPRGPRSSHQLIRLTDLTPRLQSPAMTETRPGALEPTSTEGPRGPPG